MSEPINTPTPAPAPEPTPEKTFTQAEVDAMIGKRLAKAMKGMPSEEELTAYRTWKDGQAGEKDRWDKLTGERDTLAGKLTAAEAVDELTADRKKTTFDWTAPVGGGKPKTGENDVMNALIRGVLK